MLLESSLFYKLINFLVAACAKLEFRLFYNEARNWVDFNFVIRIKKFTESERAATTQKSCPAQCYPSSVMSLAQTLL